MRSAYQIIQRPVVSEKSTTGSDVNNQYTFRVRRNANKIEIRKAVEEIYDVRVTKVNTLIRKGKERRVRRKLCRMPDWKKATVTLHADDKIDEI